MKDTSLLIGRVLLVLLFLFSGWSKINGLAGTAQSIAGKGLPAAQALATISAVVELAAAALVIVGWQTRWAALALALFTIIVTPIFHDYWSYQPPQRMGQYLNFWKNVGLVGGLLVLASAGAGAFSIDGRRRGEAVSSRSDPVVRG